MPSSRRVPTLTTLLASTGLALGLLSPLATPAHAGLPDEGECPEVSVQPAGSRGSEDAIPVKIKEGMVLQEQDLMVLRELVPSERLRQLASRARHLA